MRCCLLLPPVAATAALLPGPEQPVHPPDAMQARALRLPSCASSTWRCLLSAPRCPSLCTEGAWQSFAAGPGFRTIGCACERCPIWAAASSLCTPPRYVVFTWEQRASARSRGRPGGARDRSRRAAGAGRRRRHHPPYFIPCFEVLRVFFFAQRHTIISLPTMSTPAERFRLVPARRHSSITNAISGAFFEFLQGF